MKKYNWYVFNCIRLGMTQVRPRLSGSGFKVVGIHIAWALAMVDLVGMWILAGVQMVEAQMKTNAGAPL
jgi:hypothetical protein